MWNRYALTILDNFKSIEYLTSIFMIPCSIFDIRYSLFKSFFHDQTGRFFGQRRRSCETSFPKLELVQSTGTLHFVGWVEPTQDFVGFRCTQPNLQFAGSNAQCETQQRQIAETFSPLTLST
ncbi:hypothetical protein D1AOALGA4SA_12882 [Olavius algarvensis Delta 1 endosymbiont]|nr:hypothetical protein D1AOALGA4SA_12882 [Olavius algarvensis Delta 1 endosymbiont]